MKEELESIPYLNKKSISLNPLQREGLPRSIFIKLWTIAGDLPDWLYCKDDWNKLDSLLFSTERNPEKIDELETLFRLKWEIAKGKPRYEEEDWVLLKRIIEGK